ncbi:hypothetical protein LJC74_08575 [Eubacteriales bacterium OttesenSCG-928-A19]|nr:hypothetical protein [Eubacteriales bacterium OttesenSCG-928-A19]
MKSPRAPAFCLTMALLCGLAVAQIALPKRSFSDIENRPLAQLSTPAVRTVLSGRWMKDAETYAADQFPARDVWMSAQALWDAALLRVERNGILLGHDGWMFERSAQLALKTARDNVRAMDALAEAVEIPVTVALAPMSSAVNPENLPRWAEADDQAAILAELYAEAPHARTVDLLPALRGTAAPAFFRTDHHWTDAGATAAYDALLAAWEMSAVTGPLEITDTDGMYGSYFARAPSPLIGRDAFVMAQPEGVTLTIDGEAKDGLYDAAAMAESRDKYAQLLYGNHGRITLRSDATGGTLLVIKDSYANMLLPKLARQYGRIEAVDPRYYLGDLTALIEETEADAILCLYGLTTILSDRSLLLLSPAWGG